MSAPPDLLPSLRAELVRAAHRQQAVKRRPRMRLALLAAGTAAMVLAVAVAYELRSPAPASAGVQVTVVRGEVTVLLTDLEHRPEVIEDEVRRRGST
jgi:hypothetical protein